VASIKSAKPLVQTKREDFKVVVVGGLIYRIETQEGLT